jgi:hypothetical protein
LELVDDVRTSPPAASRALGDVVVKASLLVAAFAVGLASLQAGASDRPAREPRSRPLPLTAGTAMSPSAWTGFEGEAGGPLVLATRGEDARLAVARRGGRWRDYVVRSVLILKRGDAASVLVRIASEGDFVACTLSRGRLRIERSSAGIVVTLAEARVAVPERAARDVVVRVHGDRVAVAVDGVPTAAADVAGRGRGAVGFAVSDRAHGGGRLEVAYVSVEPYSPGPETPVPSSPRLHRVEAGSWE